jgi:hypothetical protein
MRRTKLIWIAVGAGLSALAIIASQVWRNATADTRYLHISVALNADEKERAIAAVGECTGRFEVSLPADGFVIVLPLKALSAEDFVCLTDKLSSVRHSMYIEAKDTRSN